MYSIDTSIAFSITPIQHAELYLLQVGAWRILRVHPDDLDDARLHAGVL
jgi:hypothetical protein